MTGSGVEAVAGPTATEPLLVVDDLRVQFKTGGSPIKAVDGVSFALGRGATLGVVGESGSGKSVMARSIMGLLPKEGIRTSGSVRFEGRELLGLRRAEQRRIWGPGIAIVFQDSLTSLNPVMKIGPQLVESFRAHEKISRAQALERAVKVLEDVHVPEPSHRIGQYPHELSGGLRQRVAIAIALTCSPKLLIADEPTTALDVTIQADILDLLEELQKSRGMSLIFISHNLGLVAGRTDEVAVMYAGRIVEHGRTDEVFEHTRMPYTEALLNAIPRVEMPSHSRLAAIPGRPPDPRRKLPGCHFAPRCPYVAPRCSTEEPTVGPGGPGLHRYACWFPLGAGEAAPEGEGAGALPAPVPAGVALRGPTHSGPGAPRP